MIYIILLKLSLNIVYNKFINITSELHPKNMLLLLRNLLYKKIQKNKNTGIVSNI